MRKFGKKEKNANLMLRLLIRITTENPSAWIIFIIAIEELQCFSFSSSGITGDEMSEPRTLRLLFNSISITLPSGEDVSSLVYCFDWSISWMSWRRKRCRLCRRLEHEWCALSLISHINRTRIWSKMAQIAFVIRSVNFEFVMRVSFCRCRGLSGRVR